MLFSRLAPRQRIVTLRAWVEKTAPPGPPSCRRPRCGRRGRARSSPRCGRRRTKTPLPASRSKPSIDSCRHATPQARMIVRARRTSPPSRCTSRVAASMRVVFRVTRISAPRRRACLQRAVRELVAGHAVREAEVVLDARRHAGLAARRLALDDDRAQALRRAVHRGRHPRRAAADDHGVVLGLGRLGAEVEQLGDAPERRADDGLAADHADRGPVGLGRERAAPALLRIRRVRDDRRERDLVAVEEVPQTRRTTHPSGCRRGSRAAPAARRRGPKARPRRRCGAAPAGRPRSRSAARPTRSAW